MNPPHAVVRSKHRRSLRASVLAAGVIAWLAGSPTRATLAGDGPHVTGERVSALLRGAAAELGQRASGPKRATAVAPMGVRVVGDEGLVRADERGRLHVFVRVARSDASARDALARAGLEIELANERAKVVQGWLPRTALEAVASLDFVRRVTPPIYAEAAAGQVQTEGDAIHRADLLRALGIRGKGVRVGAISDGALDFQAARDAGELPGDVSILSPGDGYEGTALLEIVHDLAPDAKLGFCSGRPTTPQTLLEFADCAQRLVDEFGADVIVDDVNFLGTPYFEDGLDAIAVGEAIAKGAVWVSAAANFGDSHYQATFVDSGDPLHSHDFGGGDVTMPVRVPLGGLNVYMQWADPFESVTDDYAVCIVNGAEPGAESCSRRVDPANPFEVLFLPCSTANACDVDIAIRLESGAAREVELFFTQRESYGPRQFGSARDSVFGHSAGRDVVSVAAINATDPGYDDVTSYSSQGPVTLFFPELVRRAKPEVSAVDCVSLSGAGQFHSPFCGTSASAPHVAGVVALLRSAFATASVAEIRGALADGAVDVGAPGYEDRGGFGRVDAVRSADLLRERVGSTPVATIVEPPGDVTIRAGEDVSFAGSCADPYAPDGFSGHWEFGAGSGVAPSDQLAPGGVTFTIVGTHRVSFTCANGAGSADPTPETRTVTVRSARGGGGGGCAVTGAGEEAAGGLAAGGLAMSLALARLRRRESRRSRA